MLWIGSKKPKPREAYILVGVDRDPPHNRVATSFFHKKFLDQWVKHHLRRGPTPTFTFAAGQPQRSTIASTSRRKDVNPDLTTILGLYQLYVDAHDAELDSLGVTRAEVLALARRLEAEERIADHLKTGMAAARAIKVYRIGFNAGAKPELAL